MGKIYLLSYFAGCGGVGYAGKMLGFETYGVESIAEIAEVYKANVGNCLVSDVRNVDPYSLPVPLFSERRRNNDILILQLSPPCKDDSLANVNADPFSERALVLKELFWQIDVLQPDAIFLENVVRYGRKNGLFKLYCDFLESRNYVYENLEIDSADFGVPQNRKRLIQRAWKRYFGELPTLVKTNSSEAIPGQLNFLNNTKVLPWVGWWDVVAPIKDTLKTSFLTDKQKKAIVSRGFINDEALLVDSKIYKKRPATVRLASEPSFTIISNHYGAMPKALLLQRIGYGSGRMPQIKANFEPAFTIKATMATDRSKGRLKTRSKFIDCLIPRFNTWESLEEIVDNSEVLSLNDLAIAAIQTFPKSYIWSDKLSLNVEMIGNAVPVLLSYRVLESFKF